MQDDSKVFSSEITRERKPLRSNLYELINVVPAKPITESRENEKMYYFEPKNDKHYMPKKKNRMKVKTVRDIRNSFEKEVNSYLPSELEKQQIFLLRKIKAGSSRDENTKTTAKKILKCDKPLSRSAWQMLMNLNPEEHSHCIQYVLWKGKCIRVNGSKGGKSKFLCNYDLSSKKPQSRNSSPGKKMSNKKIGLLQNSLTIKFKPGPLTKKIHLDDSYQKFNYGGIELANLPKAAFEIQPTYGVALDSTLSTIVQNLRDDSDGTISAKWAEFTVSVLGTVKNSCIIQNNDSSVTFDLNYKYDQRRILMRRDVDNKITENLNLSDILNPYSTNDESVIAQDVSTIINEILNSVEISLLQDNVYTGEDEHREFVKRNEIKTNLHLKDKVKKRNGELNRLDVTVIRLPEVSNEEKVDGCLHEFCSLGCICASLQCQYNLKQHCGHIECMFECKCDFSKYKAAESFDIELIPGLMNLDNEINSRLAKEEQKFHQTVVMTGEKSIVLKSEKRNWKASKRYGDFFKNLSLKTELKTKKVLSVIDVKLNCENIEPWCMVHNLYKCFCKGKFVINLLPDTATNETGAAAVAESEMPEVEFEDSQSETTVRILANKRRTNAELISVDKKPKRVSVSECSDHTTDADSGTISSRSSCARVRSYTKRKFFDSYYLDTNRKIFEMEKNDSKLHKKMMSIVNKTDSDINYNNTEEQDISNISTMEVQNQESNNAESTNDESNNDESNDSASYRDNRQSLFQGTTKKSQASSTNTSENENPGMSSVPSFNAIHEKPGTSSLLTTSNGDSPRTLNKSIKASQLLPNKTKLIAWLESSYKHYKNRMEQGIVKTSLDPPKLGKVALYPWDFILNRYRERKNLFLISNQRPYRMFMAIDTKNDFFENCINIDDIRFAELNKYPITVRNLLTNATEMKDNFCILCGLAQCWELIGSVTKIKEKNDNGEEEENFIDTDRYSLDSAPSVSNIMEMDMREMQETMNENEVSDSSKWFVMTVENDFSEIQFHKKGFFVKYESIIKAINVARMSGKTVRLSSQKCVDHNSPQFGIYAISNANEYSVFVGPYDKDDDLGIETVKTVSVIGKSKRTRGVWITTKKIDNVKVIDNPLSFMPPNNLHPSKIVSLEGDCSGTMEEEGHSAENTVKSHVNKIPGGTSRPQKGKVVKPIKIHKTNGFYHLAPKGFVKQLSFQPPQLELLQPLTNTTLSSKQISFIKPQLVSQNTEHGKTKPLLLNNLLNTKANLHCPLLNSPSTSVLIHSDKKSPTPKLSTNIENKRPVAEIAPQIKILGIYSESGDMLSANTESKKIERGMFVLKPEEINKRLMENKMKSDANLPFNSVDISERTTNEDINQDIENFLATTGVRRSPDIFVISDEEDCNNEFLKDVEEWKEVWIECKNIDNLGLILGRKNAKNELSFEFPGFKYTEFYQQEDAFSKITQVISRKIYVPKNLSLEWNVIDSLEDAKKKHVLKSEELGTDFVLTKRGLRHKSDLMAHSRNVLKINLSKATSSPQIAKMLSSHGDDVEKASDLMSDLEEHSNTLEKETSMLMEEFTKRSDSIRSLVKKSSDDQRDETTGIQLSMKSVTELLQNDDDVSSDVNPEMQ